MCPNKYIKNYYQIKKLPDANYFFVEASMNK